MKAVIHIKEADDMPYVRWMAYMQASLASLNLLNTHCISKENGKSLLKRKPR